jgi:surface protein
MKKNHFLWAVLLMAFTVFGQNNPNFYLHTNGATCMCPNAAIGETGTVKGVTYTKRTKEQITDANAATTCTSGITSMKDLFRNSRNFNGNIRSWDVSNVTDMSRMFMHAEKSINL